jgi:hypothetical protein
MNNFWLLSAHVYLSLMPTGNSVKLHNLLKILFPLSYLNVTLTKHLIIYSKDYTLLNMYLLPKLSENCINNITKDVCYQMNH